MDTNFTPGPWTFARTGGKRSKAFFVGTGLHGSVAQTTSDNERGEADARLIAAAPELFEALERMLSAHNGVIDQPGHCDQCDAKAAARAALSKAAGAAASKAMGA